MSEIIASTYEIIKEIGSGGGGVVYLANHLRLEKKVILKADKRKITTRSDLLRREVDILKELSHTYIPQVYDYFVEDDTVYTVISYIDGESLDKPLKRGEKFEQKQVIKWAREILQALAYLHSPIHGKPPRGYVHSDIKPANIMLKPNGDICLIDFNIALALGEENAVGCSKGYASPEHYGKDFSIDNSSDGSVKEGSGTEILPMARVRRNNRIDGTSSVRSTSSGSSGKRVILPDVRSDIYSLGATMYHLISGERPNQDATAVIPLSKNEYSSNLVDIISKAMKPNPDMRYQTADEMLTALSHLHRDDIRAVRWRHRNLVAFSLLSTTLLLGACSTFVGLKRMQITERWMRLTDDANTAFENGNSYEALSDVMQVYSEQNNVLAPATPAKAQETLTRILGTYELGDEFVLYKTIDLPSEPLCMALSPDEQTLSCICSGELEIIDVESAEIIDALKADKSALSEVHYINEDLIIYSGEDGINVYDLESKTRVWEGEKATGIAVSEDRSTIAAVYKDNTYALIYDADSGKEINKIDFKNRKQNITVNDLFINPHNNLFALNATGKWLAVSFDNGSLEIFDTEAQNDDNNIEIFDDSVDYRHFEGGFYQEYLAFSATTGSAEESVFAVIDTNELVQAGGFGSEGYYFASADENGIVVGIDNILVTLEPVSGEQTPLIDTSKQITQYSHDDSMTVISSGNEIIFFDRQGIEMCSYERKNVSDILISQGNTTVIGSSDSPNIWITKYSNHTDKEVAKYDPLYTHDEARLSADGTAVTLFSYDKFRICDTEGNIIKDVEIPDADNVYDQQYLRENGSSMLKVIYNDGSIDFYSANTGEKIDHTEESPPDRSLYEEFETSTMRIESPLHGTPKAYDKKTGKLISELSENAYLTYVTEVGDYVVAQYVTTDNNFFGYLMDQQCQILAYFPNVCDIYDNKILFDYPTGSIREERIYDINELQKIAREKLEEEVNDEV